MTLKLDTRSWCDPFIVFLTIFITASVGKMGVSSIIKDLANINMYKI